MFLGLPSVYPSIYGCMQLELHVTAQSMVLLHKLTVARLVTKFPTSYGTQTWITVFNRACYWTLFWAKCIKSTSSHPSIFL